ncbi:protocadherin-like wing polarity protein stan isoform X1 [Pieris brassicae]|uniref:protocadherin-like wing polarity protein stan isoform X1 n=1 Tax=Pieris brassicae TaxID=7116 RepID=UPI001E65EA45|nr:protocadherin-like wing polarity protein stan isoform X1 [Pieris brassicae]
MSALLYLALLVAAPTVRSQADKDGRNMPSLAAIALSIRSKAIQDSRCYLMNGGAVESFFIGEDTPVGSIIGTLSVNGDPEDESGNISLKLQERGAAVGIAPGTKNLTLLRVLDREEKLGPSSVYVNVRCDRRHTADPSFVIPVSVRVWDVNDNAPVWSGAPYRARVSELSAVGARVAAATATDPDQPGPHATVHYSVLPGPHSEYIKFLHELDSTLVIAKPLDYERVHNLTLNLRARDAGTPPRYNDTTLYVEVLDADDQNPKFEHEHYVAVIPDDAQDGTELETNPGPIKAWDQDEGINAPLVFSASGPGAERLRVSRDTGRLAATAMLLENLPLTVVLKAMQVDNPDRYALATVSVRRRVGRGASAAVELEPGSSMVTPGVTATAEQKEIKFTRKEYVARLPEDAAVGTLVLTLNTSPHTDRPLQFYVSERSFLEKFAINSLGEVLLRKSLDYETAATYYYQVMVTDGATNDTASLNITVDNVNEWEPRFRYPLYEFRADLDSEQDGLNGQSGASAGLIKVGQLDVYDGDAQDSVTLTLRGLHAPFFYVNAAGELFLRGEAVASLNTTVLHLVATAHDSGAPPRQSSVPVAVHVSGAGLGAEVTSAGASGVLATFVVALVLLALAVCALLIYICTVRRRIPKGDPTTDKLSSGVVAATSGSLQSVSAGATTILDSTSSLDIRQEQNNVKHSQRGPGKSKVAPSPPEAISGAERTAGAGALMSDHIAGAAGRSGVAWPSTVIPARVKKLSWDDNRHTEANDRDSVAEATNPALAEHMNLTVYF